MKTMSTDTSDTRNLSTIDLDALEVGAELVIRTCGPRPYRFRVTDQSTSGTRVIALGELRGGFYSSARRAALLGGRGSNALDSSVLRIGDRAVFLVDAVALDSSGAADRIVTSAIRGLRLADRYPEAA